MVRDTKGGKAMVNQIVKRGEIYIADLNPVKGSEQGGTRPVLILQNDLGNRHSPTVIVAAITGKPKKKLITHVPVSSSGLPKTSTVLLEQIRTIDKSRLLEYVGEAAPKDMADIGEALRKSVDV